MENASKALIMAASILLGIMIISVGVTLFNSFGSTSREIVEQIEKNQVAQFNSQFYKYYGKENIYDLEKNTYRQETIKVTAHDIVSIANLAQKNNIQYEVQNQSGKNDNTNYVQVDVIKYMSKMETRTEDELTDFIQKNMFNGTTAKYFACSNIQTSTKTGRVIYIEFMEYDKVA